MSTIERQFGRFESPDARDNSFPVSAILMQAPPQIRSKYWWADGWWGDQGNTSQCVAYSWTHWLEDGPVVQDHDKDRAKPILLPKKLYEEAQLRDQWAGQNYNGTSVRAGARVLKELGIISEYRWAYNVQEIINTVLMIGPMVVGTKWYSSMNTTDARGVINSVSGRDLGGHAYILNGVDLDKNMFRIKNSWGKDWGKDGYAFIDIDKFAELFSKGGEACVALERKITESLDWNRLSPPAINRD